MKHEKITFSYVWEMVRWCEENKDKTLHVSGRKIKWVDGELIFDEYGHEKQYVNLSNSWVNNNNFYIERDWRDEVSEYNPVLCICTDDTGRSYPDVIVKINKNKRSKYQGWASVWINAEPATAEEADKLILERM